jgi:hypothetical protein
MASNGHSIVDLTDDSDTSGMASSSNTSRHFSTPNIVDMDRSRSAATYVASASNPAKRSRIDANTFNPAALLNPRAFVANGSSPAKADIQSFPSRAKQELDRTAVSFNKRMEALHGLKDRKTQAPSAKEGKRDNSGNGGDRHAGQSLLSKNAMNGVGSTEFIDLTGTVSSSADF